MECDRVRQQFAGSCRQSNRGHADNVLSAGWIPPLITHLFSMNSQHQHQGAFAPIELSAQGDAAVATIAERHHVSPAAVTELLRAISQGRGRQAQFRHPDLGGMGQWSRGGMMMIGDMFNNVLKAKVAALCDEVAALLDKEESESAADPNSSLFAVHPTFRSNGASWPAGLGQASSSGTQNDVRYAVFPDTNRLAIERGGQVTVYDTGDHLISGFGQQQDSHNLLTLTSQHGPIRLEDLAIVSDDTAAAAKEVQMLDPADDDAGTPSVSEDAAIFAKIEGLAGLHAKGLLNDDEFHAKKTELLARL
jgi:hypothetical protein